MSAGDFAALYGALGVDPADKFRLFWDQADDATRRQLLMIAKEPVYLSGERWDALGAACRGRIKQRARDLKNWLCRVLP